MIEPLLADLYRIKIPLPNSPLKSLNAYLIRGKDRSLIIDTGMNREACLKPMLESLRELDVDLNETDFFITHLHADHSGLVGKLATPGSRVYFSAVEIAVMKSFDANARQRLQDLFSFFVSHGFPEEELKEAFQHHPGFLYGSKRDLNLYGLKEGDFLEAGAYRFSCIDTPGHSPGHMCLYEARHKILVSGDHILMDITPNITRWDIMDNSLGQYLSSLEKVYPLEVNLVLPGHRRILHDHKARIRALQEHHENRLAEVLEALDGRKKTAWDIAPHIAWDLKVRSWSAFPPVQKWFALGETIAHIEYLEAEGKVIGEKENQRVYYRLA